jgi:glucose/arabinose dehydrogenase
MTNRAARLAGLAALIALASPAGAVPTGEVRADLLVSTGLTEPLFATAPPGDSRLFVVERGGRIRIVKGTTVLATPFLDISAKVTIGGERGLLGLAFHPDYDETGDFFVYYTDSAGAITVSRFGVSGNPDVASTTEQVLLSIPHPGFANHNGGSVAFGADGFLYAGTGDGGGTNDPPENAQDLGLLLGKMLRIDVGPDFAPGSFPPSAGGVYRIPADNPFLGTPGAREEIWAYGLRNPYRFSFDRVTGAMWIGDVGQGQREEVDFEPASDPGGRNWGWDVMEGAACVLSDPSPSPPCNDPSLSLPVHDYTHSDGRCSITGGNVYRATALSNITGLYFFGDYCAGDVWTLDPLTLDVVPRDTELGLVGSGLVSFGEDGLGRVLVVFQNGRIYRLRPADPACDDGVDNDFDGQIDLADPNCHGNPLRDNERPSRCGLGAELVLLLAPLAALRARRRAARRA